METKPPVWRAILVSVQLPGVDDAAHAASLEELARLVKTLGHKVVGTLSQRREALEGATVLGKGRLRDLAARTGGTGLVGTMATAPKSKARERFDEGAAEPASMPGEPAPDDQPLADVVIVDHEISPSMPATWSGRPARTCSTAQA